MQETAVPEGARLARTEDLTDVQMIKFYPITYSTYLVNMPLC